MPPENDADPVDPVLDNDPVPVRAVPDKLREPTDYERKLRDEASKMRIRLRDTEKERDAEKARGVTAHAEYEAATTAAVKAAHAESDARIVRAEIKAAALKAGLIDLDALRMLDTTECKLGGNGDVVIPDGFFDRVRAAKPYLFTAATTSSTAPVPPAAPPVAKSARDMSRDETAALGRSLGIRV